MPLSEEKRSAFNETAANDWFYKHEGLPYGFHNFLYSWVDTPADNWPEILPIELVPIAFSILEKFDKNLTDTFFTQSLYKKLDIEWVEGQSNISTMAYEGRKRNMSISDVMAIVEEDGWKYTGEYHDGESYVCSCWVASVWKAAGIFGDHKINAVEQSPKDVY
jgi:hypothetical protein